MVPQTKKPARVEPAPACKSEEKLLADGSVRVHEAGLLDDLDDGRDILALERLDGLAHLVRVKHAHLPQSRLERAHAGAEADGGLDHTSQEHQAGKVVLDFLDAVPVAGLSGLPLFHVAVRVEVGQARHAAVGACQVRAVDAHSWPVSSCSG